MAEEPEHSPSVGDEVDMEGHVGTVTGLEDRDGEHGVCVDFGETGGSEWFPLGLLQTPDQTVR
jgi:hypothetical protein